MNAHIRGLAPPAARVQTSGAVPVHLGEGGTALTRIAPARRLLRAAMQVLLKTQVRAPTLAEALVLNPTSGCGWVRLRSNFGSGFDKTGGVGDGTRENQQKGIFTNVQLPNPSVLRTIDLAWTGGWVEEQSSAHVSRNLKATSAVCCWPHEVGRATGVEQIYIFQFQ